MHPEASDNDISEGFVPLADEKQIRIEKEKARKMRQSGWWRRKCVNGICYYCRKKFKASELTLDHIIPIIRGGRSVKENMVPCCKECNNKKRYLLPMEWKEYMESLQIPGGENDGPAE